MMSGMRFTKSFELPGTIEQVRAVLDDADFREEVAREAGATTVEASVEENDDGSLMAVVDTRQPTTGMPALATKFLGDELAIHQEEQWDSLDSASLLVSIPGQPGKVTGSVSLVESGGVTVQTVEADIKVSIPLVGGKIEKLIGSVLGHVLKIQAARATAWLEG